LPLCFLAARGPRFKMADVKAAELVVDGAHVLLARVLSVAGSAAISILVSRVLGPGGRGTYVIPAIAVAFVATIFSGLSNATTRSMLKDHAGRGALRAALLAAIPLVAGGMLATTVLTAGLHELWAAPYAAAALPFMAMASIVTGYAYGRHNVRGVAVFSAAVPVATLILLIAGFLFLGRSPRVAIPMWIAANALVATIGLGAVVRDSRRLSSLSAAAGPFLGFALRVGAAGVASTLNYRIDVYVVAAFTSHAQLGLYTLAVSAAETLLVASQVTAVVTVPHIAALSADEAARLTARCIRSTLLLAAAGAVALAIAAPLIVRALYGNAFEPAVGPLRILLLGIVPWSVAGLTSSYFTLNAGRPQYGLWTTCAAAVACGVLSLICVPRLGIAGGAIATSATYALSVVFDLFYFSRATGVGISRIVLPQAEDLRTYRKLAESFSTRSVRAAGPQSGT
jgi:O-antigen/teichoic acid export membrane protein